MTSSIEVPILFPHGSGADVGDDDEHIDGENNEANGNSDSFGHRTPPGFAVTEEQRAEFEIARQHELRCHRSHLASVMMICRKTRWRC